MTVYGYKHYKDFLKAYVSENKQKGIVAKLAQICGCDRTYISQVMNGKADLIPDHLIKLCNFFALNELETEYLMNLLLKNRASTPDAKALFHARMTKAKEKAIELSEKIKSKKNTSEISEEFKTTYYSNWLFSAVHILTSIPEYQTTPSIAAKLKCSEIVIANILRLLHENKVISKEKDRYLHNGQTLYLQREAPQIYPLHLQARIEASKKYDSKDEIHYTNYFSVSKEDVDVLKEQIIQLIETQRKTSQDSGAETACVFCCDFFTL